MNSFICVNLHEPKSEEAHSIDEEMKVEEGLKEIFGFLVTYSHVGMHVGMHV